MKPKDNHEVSGPTATYESTGVNTRKCMVYLLNGQEFQCNVERSANGEQLLRQIRELLDIIEFDYFGLYFVDSTRHRYWLEAKKSIKKQLKNSPWKFNLAVKFYPSDPSQLTEDMSRYYMVLQLKENIVTGSLPCSFVTHALLGSFAVQSELGDYDPVTMKGNYVAGFPFAPNQTAALEEKVIELHKTHKGLTPEEAEIAFLENIKKLNLYGVDQHPVKDSENVDLMLGVSWNGLRIYRDQAQINRFAWPRILKISYVRSKFYIRIRPVDDQIVDSIVGFKLPNHRAAKKLWKSAVEHHTFFRLTKPEVPKSKLIRTGSRFRYAGQTQHQTRQIVATSTRKTVPKIQRTASRRSYTDNRSKQSVSDSPSPPELPKKERTLTRTEVVTITEEVVTEKVKESPKVEVVEVTTTEEVTDVEAVQKKSKEEGSKGSSAASASSSSLSSMSDEDMDALTRHQKKVHKMKPESEAEKTDSHDGKFLQERPPGSRDSSEWDVRLHSSPSKQNTGEGETRENVTVVTTVTTEVVEEVVTSKKKQRASSSSSSSEDEVEVKEEEVAPESPPLPDFVPAVEPKSPKRSTSSSSSSSSSSHQEEEEDVEEDAEQVEPAKEEESVDKNGDEYMEPVFDIPEEKQEENEEEEEVVIENPYTEDAPTVDDHVEEVRPEEVEDSSSTSSESSSSDSALEEFKNEQTEPLEDKPTQEEEVNENNNNNEGTPEPEAHQDVEAVVPQNVITTVETKSVRVEEVVIPREDNEVRKVALTTDDDNNVSVTETRPSSSSSSSSSSSDSEEEESGAAGDQEPVFNGFKKPPIVETEAVYVEPTEEEEPAVTTEPPVVQTETRTITYESSNHQPDVIDTNDVQLLSSQTITAETMSSVTTTHITKTVVGSVSETRVEKSIVITAEGETDLHQAMAQAIKDTQESNPDVSITRVVVHEEKVIENP